MSDDEEPITVTILRHQAIMAGVALVALAVFIWLLPDRPARRECERPVPSMTVTWSGDCHEGMAQPRAR